MAPQVKPVRAAAPIVMAGLGQAWPGHPRLSYRTKDVDARDKPWDKPAHDGDNSKSTQSV